MSTYAFKNSYRTLTTRERVEIYNRKRREAAVLSRLQRINQVHEAETQQIRQGMHHSQAVQLSLF